MIRCLLLMFMCCPYAFLVLGQDGEATRAKQRQILNDPVLIHIRLVVITSKSFESQEVPEPFRPGDRVKVKVIITNSSPQTLMTSFSSTFVQHRPQLYRDGQLVKYKQDIERSLQVNENEPVLGIYQRSDVVLPPNEPKLTETIDLADWYKPLKRGHYQLAIKHRFEQGGTWIESSPVTFEVSSEQ